jgi:hypothetical protein
MSGHSAGAAALRVLARVTAPWFPSVPAQRLAALRLYVGGFAAVYLLAQVPFWLGYARFHARDFKPLGVVKLLGKTPLDDVLHVAIVIITCLLAIAFLVGFFYRVTAPLFALALLWLLSYRNSWGMPFHTENVLVLHVLVLSVVPAADAWSWDALGRAPPPDHERYGWPLRLCAAITALTYLLAGIAKLRLGGWDWTSGEALREQIAIDNLRKHLMGSSMSPIAAPLLPHTWMFEGLAIATLVIELGAPLALLHRRLALLWSIAAWGFHVGVVALMAIVFPYPLFFVAYAPLFRGERPIAWLLARWRRFRKR